MDLVPRKLAPRLLDSAVSLRAGPTDEAQVRPAREDTRRRHRRAIFLGIFGGIVLISLAGWTFSESSSRSEELRKLVGVATHSLTASPHSTATPVPIIVQLDADAVQVTAIALGHPRLAVINGTPVAEGERFVVHTPKHSVALTLRVLKISDGVVELSDGQHVIAARLIIPTLPTAQR